MIMVRFKKAFNLIVITTSILLFTTTVYCQSYHAEDALRIPVGQKSTRERMSEAFLVPNASYSRTVDIEIFEPEQKSEKKLYGAYYGHVYSDVTEFLDEQNISPPKAREIIHSDRHSIAIGIPTYSDREDLGSQIKFFQRVLNELKQLKNPGSPFKDWPVRLVINVNGLNQESLLETILSFQKDYSTPLVPVTVIHMPMGGMLPNEKTPGKKDAMNAIVSYAKDKDATIIGFIDNDTELSKGAIFSNVNFLISKARELNSPLLTGPTPVAIPADTLWAKILSRQSRNRIRGNCRFAFLFSMPPLLSLPISEDVYLRLYFADSNAMSKDAYWRILADPNSKSFYSYAPHFRSFFRQEYRWELMDLWSLSLFSEDKQNIEKRSYGLAVFVKYFKSLATDPECKSLSLKFHKFRKTFIHFIVRDATTNQLIGFELWLRQKLNKPRFSTNLRNSSRVTKLIPIETRSKLGIMQRDGNNRIGDIVEANHEEPLGAASKLAEASEALSIIADRLRAGEIVIFGDMHRGEPSPQDDEIWDHELFLSYVEQLGELSMNFSVALELPNQLEDKLNDPSVSVEDFLDEYYKLLSARNSVELARIDSEIRRPYLSRLLNTLKRFNIPIILIDDINSPRGGLGGDIDVIEQSNRDMAQKLLEGRKKYSNDSVLLMVGRNHVVPKISSIWLGGRNMNSIPGILRESGTSVKLVRPDDFQYDKEDLTKFDLVIKIDEKRQQKEYLVRSKASKTHRSTSSSL